MTLKQYLLDNDISQSELARRFGISAAAVCRMISGVHKPSLKLAIRMEVELGVECVTWL